jgi:hypothetical protein
MIDVVVFSCLYMYIVLGVIGLRISLWSRCLEGYRGLFVFSGCCTVVLRLSVSSGVGCDYYSLKYAEEFRLRVFRRWRSVVLTGQLGIIAP